MHHHHHLYLLLALLLLTACGKTKQQPTATIHRGIYHWKTTYQPTLYEKQWLKDHHIDRLYVRLFDVESGKKSDYPDWQMVPSATTIFKEPLPSDLEVIPVVYITLDAIRELHWENIDDYASFIVKRIYAMMSEHYGCPYHEVQIDCDWTEQTQRTFFLLARAIKGELHMQNISLSGTLRLHQLHLVPTKSSKNDYNSIPFDRNLLMCYNTGRLQDCNTYNSILDFHDVAPYLNKYHHNVLPQTDVAYPIYGWGVQFDNDCNFLRLINSRDLPKEVQQQGSTIIREEWGEEIEIYNVQNALPSLDTLHTVILYHLDSLNLSHYSYEDIETFYSR